MIGHRLARPSGHTRLADRSGHRSGHLSGHRPQGHRSGHPSGHRSGHLSGHRLATGQPPIRPPIGDTAFRPPLRPPIRPPVCNTDQATRLAYRSAHQATRRPPLGSPIPSGRRSDHRQTTDPDPASQAHRSGHPLAAARATLCTGHPSGPPIRPPAQTAPGHQSGHRSRPPPVGPPSGHRSWATRLATARATYQATDQATARATYRRPPLRPPIRPPIRAGGHRSGHPAGTARATLCSHPRLAADRRSRWATARPPIQATCLATAPATSASHPIRPPTRQEPVWCGGVCVRSDGTSIRAATWWSPMTHISPLRATYWDCATTVHDKYIHWEQAAIHGGFASCTRILSSQFPEFIRTDEKQPTPCDVGSVGGAMAGRFITGTAPAFGGMGRDKSFLTAKLRSAKKHRSASPPCRSSAGHA